MADWETCIPDRAYIRTNGDNTQTLLSIGVGPKERPGWDGGQWTDPEVWKVTVPDDSDVWYMWDKPHRITWEDGAPNTIDIQRWPYRGKN